MSAFQEEIKTAVTEATASLHDRIASLECLIKQIAGTQNRLIPLAEAAAILGVHEATLRRKIRNGELPCKRIGKKIFFDKSRNK